MLSGVRVVNCELRQWSKHCLGLVTKATDLAMGDLAEAGPVRLELSAARRDKKFVMNLDRPPKI
jgi:hypothetical protein